MKDQFGKTMYNTSHLRARNEIVKDLTKETRITLIDDEDEKYLARPSKSLLIVKAGFDDIPPYPHPVFIESLTKTVIDGRPYATKTGEFRKDMALTFLMKRGLLEQHAVMNPEFFTYHDGLLTDVYASWISKRVSSAAQLSDVAESQLKVLVAVYCLRNIHGDELSGNTERLVTWYLKKISKECNVPSAFIDELFTTLEDDNIAEIYSLQDVVNQFNILTDDIYRLGKNVILESTVHDSFIGSNVSELVAIGLENIGTFAIMVDYSLQGGLYGNTTIGRIVKSVKGRHKVDRFENNLKLAYNAE